MIIDREKLFNLATNDIGNAALGAVSTRYDQNPNPEFRYAYHCVEHSSLVPIRTNLILQAAEEAVPGLVNPREAKLAFMNSKGHDRFIAWYGKSMDVGGIDVVQMQRLIGFNEKTSAKEQIEAMRAKNEQYGIELFFREDELSTDEQIMVTVPGYSPELKTVVQPNLTELTSIGARAVGLADLGSAGMDWQEYIRDGDKLLREEKLYIPRTLVDLDHPISTEEKELMRSIILDWADSQVPFAIGRQKALSLELAGLPESVVKAISNLFGDFELSIQAAALRAKARAHMSLNELIADVGFLDPSKDPRAPFINPAYLN